MKKTIKELDIYISDGNYSSKYPRSEEFVEEGIPFIRGNRYGGLVTLLMMKCIILRPRNIHYC